MDKEQRMRDSLGFDEYYQDLVDNVSLTEVDRIDSTGDVIASDIGLENMNQWEIDNIHTADEVWGVVWDMFTQTKTGEEIDAYLEMNDSWSRLIGDYYITTADTLFKTSIEDMEGGLH